MAEGGLRGAGPSAFFSGSLRRQRKRSGVSRESAVWVRAGLRTPAFGAFRLACEIAGFLA